MRARSPVQPDFGAADHYLGLRDVAARLGLSPRTVRARVAQAVDPLPAYRVGGRLLFRWPEVTAWVARRRVRGVEVDAIVDEVLEVRTGQ
jgi:predicted DNA-binding transcriptional regulator AlpA